MYTLGCFLRGNARLHTVLSNSDAAAALSPLLSASASSSHPLSRAWVRLLVLLGDIASDDSSGDSAAVVTALVPAAALCPTALSTLSHFAVDLSSLDTAEKVSSACVRVCACVCMCMCVRLSP